MNAIKVFAIVLTLATVVMALVSCSAPNTKSPIALSIVAGNHANTKALNPTATEIVKKVSAAIASYGFISMVCADGNPKLSQAWTISPPVTQGLAESKLRQISTQQAKQILSTLLEIKANSPELDTLKACNTAIRSFADAPKNSERHILVLDSGLSTTGELNFLKSDFLNANPSAAVDFLNSKSAIPNFLGITVTWIGLGDIGAPQKELSPAQKDNLKKIWTGIIEKTGGKVIFLDTLPSNNDNPASDYPEVSTIDFLSDNQTNLDSVDAIVFRNIQFISDSAEYIDPKVANSILKPVADYIRTTPGFCILVIGTTAGENNEKYCLSLSANRANAVRDTLISLGAAANQIKAVGLGYSDPWHIPDITSDGTLGITQG
jgi:outer membrane protein OmpA-like peptidoglycan-associated protein